MSTIRNDLRLAWRSLTASRLNTFLAVATLALGIGINTAVFSVLDAILIRPVPYAEADRLAALYSHFEATDGSNRTYSRRGAFSPALVEAWRAQTDLFDRVEASESRSFIYEDERGAEMLTGALVTPTLLSMLGATPLEGRLFTEGDGRPGTERQVIVSERMWRMRLNRAPDVIGRILVLDEERYEVVGILPGSFRYPNESQEFWLPIDVSQPPQETGGRAWSMEPIVRFQPGLTVENADERIRSRGKGLSVAAGSDPDGTAKPFAIGQVYNEQTERSLLVLGGAVFFLLLIVCANVGNLTLSRALARSRDRAIRTALGASRGRLVREALVEYGMVGVAGAALGVLVAQFVVRVTVASLPEAMTISSLNAIDVDGRALMFLLVTAVLTVFVFGLPPAFVSARATVAEALRRETRSSTGSVAARRVRSGMAVAEIGLSIVLLVGAALMTRTMMQLQAIDTGIDTKNLLVTDLALPAPQYTDVAARGVIVNALLDRLRRDPDIVSAGAGTIPPTTTVVTMGRLEFGDRPGETTEGKLLRVFDVWPGFFEAAGIRVLDGRGFRSEEVEGAVIVADAFAREHWPAGGAVGQRFRVGAEGQWRTVVGVAADVRGRAPVDLSGESEGGHIYYPFDQVTGVWRAVRPASRIAEYRTIVVRARTPDAVATRLADLVHAVDAQIVVGRTRLVEQQFADEIARPRIVFVMMAAFAGVGLVLAVAGLYGVLSHLVAQRMREMGIRLALGATPRDIGRAIMGSGLTLAAVGVALGLAASLGLVGLMRSLLYEVEPFDPAAIGAVCVLLIGSAMAAAWWPARRAMAANPVVLLRDE